MKTRSLWNLLICLTLVLWTGAQSCFSLPVPEALLAKVEGRGACLFLALSGARGAGSQSKTTTETLTPRKMLEEPWAHSTQIQDFAAHSPDESFTLLHAMWSEDKSSAGKILLLHLFATPANPHLLEVLGLGLRDPDETVAEEADRLIPNYAFRRFRLEPQAYDAWQKKSIGRPVETIIRENGRAVFAEIARSDAGRIDGLLEPLESVDFASGTPLAALRRQLALENRLPESLARWLPPAYKPTLKPGRLFILSDRALNVLRRLEPDEAYARRLLLPLTLKGNPEDIREGAIRALGTVRKPWVSELLLKMLPQEYPQPVWKAAALGLGEQKDPHLIPTLIAILDEDDTRETAAAVAEALSPVTGVTPNPNCDSSWWHVWWLRNKNRYPADVRNRPFPHLALRGPHDPGGFLIRRKIELYQIEDDPQRAYRLISPGYLPGFRYMEMGRALPGVKRPTRATTLGLLIVPAGSSENTERLSAYWLEAATRALHSSYLVALVSAPQWSMDQRIPWVTRSDQVLFKSARFTVETFLDQVVTDVRYHYPVDPAHIFLYGAAQNGPAAYACSLQARTPFQGFYIVDSAFPTAQLPPLSAAKGRRYVIQNRLPGKPATHGPAETARQLLTQQGAVVRLLSTSGPLATMPTESDLLRIGQACDWLEDGK